MPALRRRPLHVHAVLPLLAVASVAACAGAPPPPVVVPPPPPLPVAAAPRVVEPEAPPLHPVVTVSLAHPRRSFQALGALLGKQPAWRKATATLELLGAGLEGAVDVDRPVLLAMTGEKRFAVALEVVAGQGPRLAERFHLATSVDGGFRPTKDPRQDDSAPFSCSVVPTPGHTLRLVCAPDASTVRDFAPTLARTVADESGPDVRFEVAADPIRTALIEGSQRQQDTDSASRREGRQIGEKLVAQLADDLDGIVLEGLLKGDLEATLHVRLRGDTSPIVHALTAHPLPEGPPTAAFWHLPVDTGLAFFTQGVDASDLEPLKSLFFDGLEDSLRAEGCGDQVAYAGARMRSLFLTGGPAVVGLGGDEAGARKALAALREPGKATDASRLRARQALATWALFEVDEPASRWVGPLRELALLETTIGKCKPTTPPDDDDPPKEVSTQAVVPVPAAAHLPKGTLHLATHTNPTRDAQKSAARPRTTHIFVVPDGGHTWFAIGESEATVLGRVKAALDGAPAVGTLASRGGLDSLRAAAAGGGFVTPQGITILDLRSAGGDELDAADSRLGALASLSSKGTLPIPLSWRATPHDLSVRVTVPSAAVADLLTLRKQTAPVATPSSR